MASAKFEKAVPNIQLTDGWAKMLRKRARCSICGEDIPRRRPHLKTCHPDFVLWHRRWLRNFFSSYVLLVIALVLTYYLWFRDGNVYPAGIATLLFIVFVYSMMRIWVRKNRQFIRAWKEEHGDSSQQSAAGVTQS